MRRIPSHLILILLSGLLAGACATHTPGDPDQAALDSLREAGSDFTKTHPFDFYLYHPDQSGARQMCGELSGEGFRTTLREGVGEGEWLCLATINFVPSIDRLSEIQVMMAKLVDRFGGEYDGWETLVIP